jgi:hypothetical protein
MNQKEEERRGMDPIHYVTEPTVDYPDLPYCRQEISPGWYFWDEVWVNRHGPFESREQAQEALNHYFRILDRGPDRNELERQALEQERNAGYCPKCGQNYCNHNDDGSCVED